MSEISGWLNTKLNTVCAAEVIMLRSSMAQSLVATSVLVTNSPLSAAASFVLVGGDTVSRNRCRLHLGNKMPLWQLFTWSRWSAMLLMCIFEKL